MCEREQLLRAVLEDPFEDTVRLAYADHLEEHAAGVECGRCFEFGSRRVIQNPNPRRGSSAIVVCPTCQGTGRRPDGKRELAEFIRDSVADSSHTIDLNGPGMHLFARDHETILIEMPSDVHGIVRRGFVDEIRVPVETFFEHAAAVFRRHPVTKVVITEGMPIFPSGGNDTYYVGNLGMFPVGYWRRLDGHRSRRDAELARSRACVDLGRELAGLKPLVYAGGHV